MKLHFSIAAAEELRERRGGRYVLYSVCLKGFLLGKVRYSQLRRWDAQLRQLFGSAVPGFPPKFYLVMTKLMADERQSQLEQYLQNVTLHSNITSIVVFIGFFQKLQLDTFKIPTQRAFSDVYLADGSNVRLDIQTSDTAERILELLELIREVQFYGYVWLDPCTCDYAEEGCSADICVGNNEIKCCIKLPTNQTKEVSFKINRVLQSTVKKTHELQFESNDSGTWQWITLYTKQAFVLSNCLKKIISEQVMKAAKEGQEMEIQMSKSIKSSKKSTIQQKQVIHSRFISRKKIWLGQVKRTVYLRK